jgi:hypothetical protein
MHVIFILSICLPSMCYFILWRDTTSELWTPVLFPLYCYHIFTLLALFTLLAYYYCFPLDTLIPLFQANRWDWQPHRKFRARYLVVLCAGSTLPLAKQSLDEAPYKLSGAIVKLAGITFWSLAFSWTDKPWFLTERKACCYTHHTFLLGFPTGRWKTINTVPHQGWGEFLRQSRKIGRDHKKEVNKEERYDKTPVGGVFLARQTLKEEKLIKRYHSWYGI